MREALKTHEWKALKPWGEAGLTLLHKPEEEQEQTPCSDSKAASGEYEWTGAQGAERAHSVWCGGSRGGSYVSLHSKGAHPPALEAISAGGHHALGRNTAMFSTSWPTMSSAPTGKDVVTQMKCPWTHAVVHVTGYRECQSLVLERSSSRDNSCVTRWLIWSGWWQSWESR